MHLYRQKNVVLQLEERYQKLVFKITNKSKNLHIIKLVFDSFTLTTLAKSFLYEKLKQILETCFGFVKKKKLEESDKNYSRLANIMVNGEMEFGGYLHT